MTLNEAILTGMPFKRPHHPDFIVQDAQGVLKWQNHSNPLTFSTDAILASDYIVQFTSDYVKDCFDTVLPDDCDYGDLKKDFYLELGI